MDAQLISWTKPLSEDFIRAHAAEISWVGVSHTQRLSESFIREFADRLDWDGISMTQELSISLIREFHERIVFDDYIRQRIRDEHKLMVLGHALPAEVIGHIRAFM
jgi:hypothetical protein